MIHQLLNLQRPLFVLDTETTGLDVQKDRIIELALEQWTADGLTKEYRTLVNPGIPIPASATKVHTYRDSDFKICVTCGQPLDGHPIGKASETINYACITPKQWPTFKQLAPNLAKGFTDCDFAGKNIRFDLRILTAEFARAGVPWTIGDARIVDADRLEALLNPRSLSHLYEKYVGKKLEGAHGALADVKATTAVLVGQLSSVPTGEVLPASLDALHALQFPGMIDLDNKFIFINGVPCFGRWGKFAGQPMTAADNGYWDFILKNDFSADVKRLAGEAKLCKFPEEKK